MSAGSGQIKFDNEYQPDHGSVYSMHDHSHTLIYNVSSTIYS